MNRILASSLVLLFPLTAADFAILNLRIVEGEGMVYSPGSRATRGVTIEVTDESARPVAGVAVSFQLPAEGPSGEFMNGGKTDIATTGEDGRATVWGMRWNKSPGTVKLRITAAKGGVRAGMVVEQRLDASVPEQTVRIARGGRTKWLILTAVIAGAGAGVAAGTLRSSSNASAPPVAPTLSIGAPSGVNIGAP